MFIYHIDIILKMDNYLAGVLFGDGTCYKAKNGAYSVWIDQHERNKKVLDRVSQLLIQGGFKVYRYATNNSKSRVLTYSKKLFIEFSLLKNKPLDHFRGLNKNGKKEFIAGLFDAEGTQTDRVVIYNEHLLLLEEIKRFLETISIESHIYKFGKVFGIQIYRKIHLNRFISEIRAIRLSTSLGQKT